MPTGRRNPEPSFWWSSLFFWRGRMKQKLNGIICKVKGCDNKAYRRGYCNKHNLQIKRHGRILARTYYDENKIIQASQYCIMELCNRKHEPVAETIFDIEDYHKVKKNRWNLSHYGYAKCIKLKTCLHNFVLRESPDAEMPVDHINGNKLDNRKCNLRICTRSQNAMNAQISKGNTSGYKGVCLDKASGKWVAAINPGGKKKSLGRHQQIQHAAKAYNNAAIKVFGEYARLNNVEEA